MKHGAHTKLKIVEIDAPARRSFTTPDDIEIDMESNENHERRGSADNASENELMSASFFDEEEANCELGR